MIFCRNIFTFILLFQFTWVLSQEQFDRHKLTDAKKYGREISDLLHTVEIDEFRDTNAQTLFLKNGFRSSDFVNGADWMHLKDSVEVYRIDVVYSKYPLRKGVYSEIYPLLFNRLNNLFAFDNDLNDATVEWNKVLQTHCVDDKQVDQLLHGVLIWYRPYSEETDVEEVFTDQLIEDPSRTAGAAQASYADLRTSISYVEQSTFFSDSLKQLLVGKTMDEQRAIIRRVLEAEQKSKPDQDLSKIEKIQRDRYLTELNSVVNLYRSDSIVFKVLSRHPEWQQVAVVNDWTGSMYGYGSQVVEWHIRHHEISGIEQITLFNDGDSKSTFDKKVGETGGIYTQKADNVEKLIGLFQLVMMNGFGGDGPENDIEAILAAIAERDDLKEVVLIADNYPCIRDISLAKLIDVPVRVIVCGYNEGYGINPDLVYLAKITNGGLYTIEDDLENLQINYTETGEVVDSKESRFKIAKKRCESDKLIVVSTPQQSMKAIRFQLKKHIHQLDLSKQLLPVVPKRIYKLTALNYLDLSKNMITSLDAGIGHLKRLDYLNLSDNLILDLPSSITELNYLKELHLANNGFRDLPKKIFDLPFLVKLDLSGNHLSVLEKVVNLRRLTRCNLSTNDLSSLPRSFQSVKNLQLLDLSNNQFTEFPIALNNLRKLEELHLSNNQLTSFPTEASGMKGLKILHLEGNNFPVEEQERIRKVFAKAMVYF